MVGMKGLEPSRLAAHAPKACVSTIPPHPRGVDEIIIAYIGLICSIDFVLMVNDSY